MHNNGDRGCCISLCGPRFILVSTAVKKFFRMKYKTIYIPLNTWRLRSSQIYSINNHSHNRFQQLQTHSSFPTTQTMMFKALFFAALIFSMSVNAADPKAKDGPMEETSLHLSRRDQKGYWESFKPCCTCGDIIKKIYLSLSDDELYRLATNNLIYSTGDRPCRISLSRYPSSAFCDLYVNSACPGRTGHYGWPRNNNDEGTGCVRALDFPRHMPICWYGHSNYDLPVSDIASFCTNFGKKNAVAQLRHAIKNDQCKFCPQVKA